MNKRIRQRERERERERERIPWGLSDGETRAKRMKPEKKGRGILPVLEKKGERGGKRKFKVKQRKNVFY